MKILEILTQKSFYFSKQQQSQKKIVGFLGTSITWGVIHPGFDINKMIIQWLRYFKLIQNKLKPTKLLIGRP